MELDAMLAVDIIYHSKALKTNLSLAKKKTYFLPDNSDHSW